MGIVAGNINKFEVNYYDKKYNTTTTSAYQCMFEELFDLVKQFTGESAKFNHIHKKG
ncbi:9943_t:CDS:2 [Cetraspora pellucida]|uniref:9943_t:CDS:1 n=1 Tax=Cetraspora pellucida TaxID=1433469 RepID=A0ACA9JX73_9GLOM|nr:9943_t:CDS:2 [Cetraspora pellucida]